jgi:ribosomal protein S18 acetylase RimI-like enzyme
MRYWYEINPKLDAEQVGELRQMVGWDERVDKYRRILGTTYLCVACFSLDKLIGYVDVISDGIDDAYVRDLMVHPDYQRRGIGSTLLSMVKERIKKNRIKMVSLVFEPGLIDFYRKAGFYIIAGGLIDFETAPD